jgi:hypothetical protein
MMSNFKVGDRVRIVGEPRAEIGKERHIGTRTVISGQTKNPWPQRLYPGEFKYILEGDTEFYWFENELVLIPSITLPSELFEID